MKYPDDCPQSFVSDKWWCQIPCQKPQTGHLLWAIVNHASVLPYRLVAEGRNDPTDHTSARFKVEQFSAGSKPKDQILPIAALPQFVGESYGVYRAKVRPVLVLASDFEEVEKFLANGHAPYQVTPSMIVAPYYGITPGNRQGFQENFVARIRHLTYRQYFWDLLPLKGSADGSILRFDHILSIGSNSKWYTTTGWTLCDSAVTFLQQYLMWILKGEIHDDISEIRKTLMEF